MILQPSQIEKINREVIVIPVNGLSNRLRAIASGLILANQIGATFSFSWPLSEIMQCKPEDILSEDFIKEAFLTKDLSEVAEATRENQPFFVEFKTENSRVVSFSGGREGEQRFMQKLEEICSVEESNLRIIIKSGGLFHFCKGNCKSDCSNFQENRRQIYSKLGKSQEVQKRLDEALNHLPKNFGSLHLRFSDKRIDQSISPYRIFRFTLKRGRELSGQNFPLFICGDEHSEIENMAEKFSKQNIQVFRRQNINLERNTEESAVDAYVDWLILSRSKWLVYFTNTSFSYEAAIFGGFTDSSYRIHQRFSNARSIKAKILSSLIFKINQISSNR